MKKIIFTFFITMFAVTLFAVPAKRGLQSILQPDGTTINIALHGDEFFHYTTTEDGYLVAPNANGIYEYADIANDNAIEPMGIKAYSKVEAKNKGYAKLAKDVLSGNERNTAKRRKIAQADRLQKASGTPVARTLVLLVEFPDRSMTATHTLMNNMLNGTNATFDYTEDGATGSVKKYFSDQSNGQYVPEFDVVGPIRVSRNSTYYGQNDRNGDDLYIGELISEACTIADEEWDIDFSQYDSDDDGIVDAVYVIYAGYGENISGAPANYIWPHRWTLYYALGGMYPPMFDGVYVNPYACNNELEGLSGSNINGIGTFCHEFSHIIGLPDYYDIDYGANYRNNATPGTWTLMDQGSYNNDGKTPPNYSAYDKYYMGWVTPTIMNAKENVTLQANGQDYRVVTAAGTQPAATYTNWAWYFENRQQTGWDEYCAGHGLLVFKVQFNQTVWNNNGPNDGTTMYYDIVEADGRSTGGDAGDTYPGTSNRTSFTPTGSYALTEIAENSGVITFKFMGGVDEGGENGEGEEQLGNGDYVKVTSEPSDWSGEYLIVYEDGSSIFDGSRTTLDAASNYQSVTITNNTISATPNDNYRFTITKSGDAYTIKSISGYYIGQTSNANGLKSNLTTQYPNTISLNNDNSVNITSGGAYMRYNSNTNNGLRFRYYKSNSYTQQKAIALFKKVEEDLTTDIRPIQLSDEVKVVSLAGGIKLLNIPMESEVKVFNLAGQMVHSIKNTFGNQQINLQKGVYILQLTNNYKNQTIKAIVK